ncbi:unnamed protein product [Parascedosporium putredinis]|uniref:Uncharacterized protein n=1 Tax=Parascedosporium putredinis TaxID=1442378 RepID=A0A9P1HBW4_9PEZI|nr:unnamed protein product [Parascedosporium putredinis]CAI8002606.1 unnamed protein product [Parascedosporium putredinis]
MLRRPATTLSITAEDVAASGGGAAARAGGGSWGPGVDDTQMMEATEEEVFAAHQREQARQVQEQQAQRSRDERIGVSRRGRGR